MRVRSRCVRVGGCGVYVCVFVCECVSVSVCTTDECVCAQSAASMTARAASVSVCVGCDHMHGTCCMCEKWHASVWV